MKVKLFATLLALLLGAGAYAGVSLATNSSGQTTTTLAQATIENLDLTGQAQVTNDNGREHPDGAWRAWIKTHGTSDMYVVDNKFVPGGTSGWHSHPGPSIIFVVAGTVTNYATDADCRPATYSAGSSFVDPGGDDAHMLRNEGTVLAETIAVQVVPHGVNRKIDVTPAPEGCPA
jgi:quercetin dioxygenase-like cupin family protein